MASNLYLLYLGLLEVTDIGPWCLVHKRGIISIGLWQSDLVWNVRVHSLVGRCFCCKGRVVLLHHFLLHPDPPLLLIPLLVPYHLQIFDFSLGSRGQTFFHPLPCIFQRTFNIFPLILELDNIGLAHWEFWDSCFHFSSEIPESTLELIDLFRHFKSGLSSFSGIFLELVNKIGDLIQDKFLFKQLLLLAVESFLNDTDLSIKSFLIRVFSF